MRNSIIKKGKRQSETSPLESQQRVVVSAYQAHVQQLANKLDIMDQDEFMHALRLCANESTQHYMEILDAPKPVNIV